ncbi:MAG: hypothetical protein ACKOB8_07490 [Mycobacterium sp.]
MKDVNWWLMTLAFLLGLLLTFAMMIRRVTREVPVTATVSATLAGAAGTLESVLEKEPYGPGSVRLVAAATEPGFTIKGNEDSMLYHTTDSPWYKQTIAEVWFADEDSATRAGFTRWDAGRGGKGAAALVASIEEVPAGPYGRGSAAPGADGAGPAGWPIKGNVDSMLYHPPDSPAYTETIAEVWFFDEETAKAAGFDKWDKNFR